MKARKLLDKEEFDYDHFTRLTSTGIKPDYNTIAQFAEYYHQEQLKLLNIDNVSVSDSEIDNYASNQAQEYSDFEGEQIEIAESLSEGAKWMRDKIKTH